MIWITKKYINLLSSKLTNFKEVNENTYTFRCPYCGDSEKSRSKTRGYIYKANNKIFYKCHNCGVSTTFDNLIKHVDEGMYNEYKLEKLKERGYTLKEQPKKVDVVFNTFAEKTNKFITLDKLPKNHEAVLYCEKRKLLPKFTNELFYVDNINTFKMQFEKYKNRDFKINSKFVGIPFYVNGNLNYVQLRNINTDEPRLRFVTMEIIEGSSKVFGFDGVDKTKPIYVFEGPMDAMTINNSVATAGAAHKASHSFLESCFGENLVYVFDNDFRENKDVLKMLKQKIKQNHKVVIFDSNFEYKDVNEARMKGMSVEEIELYLLKNTFQGARAMLEISNK